MVFMTTVMKKNVEMLEMLPIEEQQFAGEIIKKLVRAWDPDFTKLTPKEAEELRLAREESEYFTHDEIDWDNLDKMDLD
jgi:hypothetical protein